MKLCTDNRGIFGKNGCSCRQGTARKGENCENKGITKDFSFFSNNLFPIVKRPVCNRNRVFLQSTNQLRK